MRQCKTEFSAYAVVFGSCPGTDYRKGMSYIWDISVQTEDNPWGVIVNRETAMDRKQKEAQVKVLEGIFADAGSVVMAEYSGMTVAELTDLRAASREHGATIKVVKNRLAKIALKDKFGAELTDLFKGPVAIAYAEDMISAPKVAVKFAKDSDYFNVLGGFMGEEVFDVAGIETLSKLPSREELIGMAAARLLGQASEIGSRLNSVGSALAGAISVIKEKAAA